MKVFQVIIILFCLISNVFPRHYADDSENPCHTKYYQSSWAVPIHYIYSCLFVETFKETAGVYTAQETAENIQKTINETAAQFNATVKDIEDGAKKVEEKINTTWNSIKEFWQSVLDFFRTKYNSIIGKGMLDKTLKTYKLIKKS